MVVQDIGSKNAEAGRGQNGGSTSEYSQSESMRGGPSVRQGKRSSYWTVSILLLLLLVGAAVSFIVRLAETRALAKETETLAVPTVEVIHPEPGAAQSDIILPSSLQAFTESPIYARTNGYLGKWYKDIGAQVKKGELLADIETPEIDQELIQAQAIRDQAQAQLNLAKSSAARWEDLRKLDAVAQQETDERQSGAIQGQAALASANASLRRLEQLESFKHIYAPFSGVITKRNIDIGSLINAGNTGTNQELFNIALVDPIRVYVDVPQPYSPGIHRGVKAEVQLAEMPGQHFLGNVVRTSDSIDPTTRTLRTEIDLPNHNGKLFPGAYAQVHLAMNALVPSLSVPVNALLFRAEGVRAAVIGSDGKVHMKPVQIGSDYGTDVQVLGGLDLSDSLILNPSDSLEEGQQVNIGQAQGQSQGGKP